MDARMVIVGAGECGVRAAFALRENGHRGPVTLIGDEPHLPYERPPLSKPGEDGGMLRPIVSAEAYAQAGIEWLSGVAAAAIDRDAGRVALSDGRTVPYDRLLLATGGMPRRLANAAPSPRLLALRMLDDARTLHRRLAAGGHIVIVGGGFIGLETAALARRRGMAVTVLESRPRLLMRGVPADIAEHLHARHVAEGVDIRCGTAIHAIEDVGDAISVRLAGGETLVADFVLAGVGSDPNTSLAERAGLAIDNGIAVDATLASSDPDIFAAGDCCSFPRGDRRIRLESWRAAQQQGALAARNMLGAGETYTAVPWFWSDQYDLGLQITGLPDEGVRAIRRNLPDGAFILFHLDGSGRLVAAGGIGRGNAVARDMRLAEMLIAAGTPCDAARLADPGFRLKAMLSA